MNIALLDRIEYFLSRLGHGRSLQSATGLGIGSYIGPREDNQDRVVVSHLNLPSGEVIVVAMVCDGMGGMNSGGEAAASAASCFISSLIENYRLPNKELVSQAVAYANNEVFNRFHGSGGTTLTALVSKGNNDIWVAHIGDSRLYGISSSRELDQLTRDDTLGEHVRTPSNKDEDVLDNRLLQFVGIGSSIEPHIFKVKNDQFSGFLLTSDGAHSIGKKVLEGVTRNSGSPAECVRKLIFVAEAAGVEDNSSAVSISLKDFNPVPKFTDGLEVVIWSAGEKVEIWLDQNQQANDSSEEDSRPQTENTWKPAKAERPKNKVQRKKPKNKAPEKVEPEVKPQLNIEFGGGDKE